MGYQNKRKQKKGYLKKKMQESKGITLQALVVTIILLIILAGIALNMVIGEDGILIRAKDSKRTQDVARISEKLELEKGKVGIDNEYKAKLNRICRTYKKYRLN